MIRRFGLGSASLVVEIGANDGYLLQYIQENKIPCFGVEPTASTAKAAREKGIEIVEDFFGICLANELKAHGKQADLIVANNVLPHVPDINDFLAGFSILLNPHGLAVFEFPHLIRLVGGNQFDTIYHEHFSYLSLTSAERVFEYNGLVIFDVEEIPTHGGSLRVYAQRRETGKHPTGPRVGELLAREATAGLTSANYYAGFQERINRVKDDFLIFLIEAKRAGKKVAGYGAAAKGNTLLNYAGVRPDLLPYVVDRNPAKQGKFLPGSRIPIVEEERLKLDRPDYIVILPWNIKEELMAQLVYIRDWGGKFVTAVPILHGELQ